MIFPWRFLFSAWKCRKEENNSSSFVLCIAVLRTKCATSKGDCRRRNSLFSFYRQERTVGKETERREGKGETLAVLCGQTNWLIYSSCANRSGTYYRREDLAARGIDGRRCESRQVSRPIISSA